MNVQSILGSKGSAVATIGQTATLHDAITELGQRGIGALVVSNDGQSIDGIISERDIVRATAEAGGAALGKSVGSAMSSDVVTCSLGDGVDHLMSLMTGRRIRHLPVSDEVGHLVGIVSIGDVVKARLTELEHENEALSQYISGH